MNASVAEAERLLSLEEFYREYEGRRAYLIDGVVHEVTPPNPPHVYGTDTLRELLEAIAPAGTSVRKEDPLEIGTRTDPEPDVAVVRGSRDDYRYRHPNATDALLVVEVCDATLVKDRRDKLPKYAGAGIREVWMVDLAKGEVEVCRDPAGTAYRSRETYRRGERITPLFGGELVIGDWAQK